jgi:hypothetical protein
MNTPRCAAPWRLLAAAAFSVTAAMLPLALSAQVKPGATAADVALYQGTDRLQKLIAGAKKEGVLNIYTSAQSNDLGPVVAAFEKKYGIRTTLWRSSSENVLNRVVQESRGNRFTVDIVETNGPELEALHREQILQLVKSPYHADLIAPAIRPHGEWVGTRLNVFVQAYNTRLVKKEDLPKTWEDLVNPKWKGKLGIEREGTDWLAGVFSEIGEAKGRKILGHRRGESDLGAEGPYAPHPARGLGRGAPGPHGLQLQGRAAESAGSADRLVRDRQCHRTPQRSGCGTPGAQSARGRALLRLRVERRRAEDYCHAGFRTDQQEDRHPPQQAADGFHRCAGVARREREVDETLRRAVRRRRAVAGC